MIYLDRGLILPFILLFLLFFSFLIISPFIAEKGTISRLDGEEKKLDNKEEWVNMSLVPRVIYTIGDFVCHQKEDRSFHLNGNQMPVCARDIGIYLGCVLGLVLILPLRISSSFSDTFMRPFRYMRLRSIRTGMSKLKKWSIIVIIMAVFTLPMAVDGLVQTLTNYESVNYLRFATGLLFGMVGLYFLGVLLSSALKDAYG